MQTQTESDLFNWGQIQDDRSFWQYHADNPKIYEFFKLYAFRRVNGGLKHLRAKGLIELARDSWELEHKEKLKINNNYTAGYARLFIKEHPQYKSYFELRELKASTNKDI